MRKVGGGKRRTVLYPMADLQAWLSRQADAEKGPTMTTLLRRLLDEAARRQARPARAGRPGARRTKIGGRV